MPRRDADKVELMTAGYEGETQDEFVAKLKAAGVERVIDAREMPLSRKRGFSKKPLSERLAAEGIDYVHFKEVGTPKPWRDEYKRTKDFKTMEKKYERYLDEHMAAVGQVHELAVEKRSALLCFEADAHMCHRSTLARRILETFGDMRVVNLRARQGVPSSVLSKEE